MFILQIEVENVKGLTLDILDLDLCTEVAAGLLCRKRQF